MKVALVNPKNANSIKRENIGIAYLASYLLQNDVEVVIVDEIAGADAETDLASVQPDIVGISCMTMFAPRAYRIAEFVKRELGCTVVLGGAHPSGMPLEAKQHADYVVVGEGEIALLDIIRGKAESSIIKGELVKDIDSLPMPARHLLDTDFYLRQKEEVVPHKFSALSMLTSRGCPYKCTFCHNSDTGVTGTSRYHSNEYVINELRYLVEHYPIEGLALLDENLGIYKKRLRSLCRAIIDNGFNHLKWTCQTHSKTADLETLELMKAAGCIEAAFGIESGSQRILDILKKKTKVKDNVQALANAKKVGLRTRGFFIIGNPTETYEDVELTRRFIMDNPIDYVAVFLSTPYPGTELWRWADEHGLIPWDRLDYEGMNTGADVNFTACETIPFDELRRLHSEIAVMALRRNYSTLDVIGKVIKFPRATLRYVRNYLRVA